MSHRVRSKTVDSADTKRGGKGAAPRRITEKIAIIKKREHQQSAEFEQAMQSIFEMQQARIHPGGGSMPSLQAIDSTPPAPSIDMQSIFRDFDKMKRGSGATRMESNFQRGPPLTKHSSMETEPYLPVNLSSSDHHYWNGSGDWLEGELARHKSDSDLQQSLMMGGQTSPHVLNSPQQQLLHRQHKMNPPVDVWSNKRPNSATTHALLSPDHYMPSPERLTPPPMGGASVGTASSLPDLTNIEFSCGLDVPLERDESPLQDPQQYALPPLMQSFHPSPTIRMTGPSNLVYNSFQAPSNAYYSSPPNSGGVYPSPPVSGGYQQLSPLSMGSGISRSPTMPEFRNIHSTNGFVSRYRPPPPLPTQYKPILPNAPLPLAARLSELLPQVRMIPGHTPSSTNAPPPMTIIIQPPPSVSTSQSAPIRQQSMPNSFPHDPSMTSYDTPPPLSPDKASANQYLNGVPTQKNLSSSTTVPSSFGLCLPSYTEARLQQSLQHKFASINVGRTEGMVRSHSEENLQKVQKEKPEVIQHNPFMGTLANANSVPCVYVDPSGPETYYNERSDSPPIDSPSTSASYASSPPSVRPYWIEEEGSLREYVFNEWPLEGGGGGQRSGSPPAHHRSLSDLGSIIPDITDLISSNRSHQLSLPSVAMTDLTVDEQLDKMNSPSDYYHDYEMEEAMMNSLLKNGVPNVHPFDVFPCDQAAASLDGSPFHLN
ncbi:CREB-regulated transcription coactivator 1-like isoform X2 [Halichondria panicea]|uniref:CREB-regulated transcription coactivator 1-like isoform X2 n=1 Tax=Halichondria panicea TaxID=6063 RepID=UPI00312B5F9D